MNEVPSNFDRLVTELLGRTESGQLRWKPEDDDRTAFSLSLQHGSLTLVSVDGDGAPPIELSVLDPDGVVVQRVVFNGLDDQMELWRLFQAARSNSHAARIVVDGLLHDLDRLDLPF